MVKEHFKAKNKQTTLHIFDLNTIKSLERMSGSKKKVVYFCGISRLQLNQQFIKEILFTNQLKVLVQ